MLILERHTTEDVCIFVPGRERPIVIRVVKTMPGRMKIGIIADADVRIARRELCDEAELEGIEKSKAESDASKDTPGRIHGAMDGQGGPAGTVAAKMGRAR